MLGPTELIVMAFPEEGKAKQASKALQDLQRQGVLRLFNAAVIAKDVSGRAFLAETEDIDAKRGALFGALVGGLVGLLGGPPGAIAGAAAGALTGGVAANRMDMGFSKEFLSELEEALPPGSSAILAIVEHQWIDRLIAELERYQGKLIRQALKDELAAQLAEGGKETGE